MHENTTELCEKTLHLLNELKFGIYECEYDVNGCTSRAVYIDKVSRKLFPLAFLSFNIIYWICYVM
ncbi:hypothetical protein A3Q56_00107 [Intoshia linei]|uniref:Uncharacterized protein n=1 Tax=Intoshia linei TaxID=1819745 RepID=A0A177BEW2_9BILA|nr:hypothetical protein A3Q56_00107 [Intoshia linei]